MHLEELTCKNINGVHIEIHRIMRNFDYEGFSSSYERENNIVQCLATAGREM
jgi:hypothetical protein